LKRIRDCGFQDTERFRFCRSYLNSSSVVLRRPRRVTYDQHVPLSERLPELLPRILEVHGEQGGPRRAWKGFPRKPPGVREKSDPRSPSTPEQVRRDEAKSRNVPKSRRTQEHAPSRVKACGQTNQTVILVNDSPSVSCGLEGDKVQLADVYPTRRRYEWSIPVSIANFT